MALDSLVSTLMDYTFFAGGNVCDNLSTYYFVTRDGGPQNEGAVLLRYSMEKDGVRKALLRSTKNALVGGVIYLGVTYGADCLLGWEDNLINLHHLFCYGIGGEKYWAAITNMIGEFGFRKTAHFLQTPLRWQTKAMNKVLLYVGRRMISKSQSTP